MPDPLYPYLMPITPRPDVCFHSGKGSWLYDQHGRGWLDFVQGWAVNTLGHAPAPLVDAVRQQAAILLNVGPGYYSAPMLALACELAQCSGLDEVCFTNSGAEANEAAFKLARKWGQARGAFEIITTQHSFHGRTLAAMAASGKPQWDALYQPGLPGFVKVPYNDVAAVAAAIGPRTVAIMVEPIQGEAGVIVPAADYLQRLRTLADEHGLLLIVDEIQTGIGRTGSLFAYQAAGIRPDIVTLAKGLGGGVPIGAMLARHQVSCFDYGDQGGTFAGNALTTAVALAVLQQVRRPEFLAQVRASGDLLRATLQALATEFGLGAVRGQGLLLALEIPAGNARLLAERAFAAGLLINAPQAGCLRIMPALNVSAYEIEDMGRRLRQALLAH